MSVKYDKSRDKFKIRHYEDLSDVEILKGMKNIENVTEEIDSLIKKKREINLEYKRISAEIEDLRNYQDVISRVTHTYNGVPVMQVYNEPNDENRYCGTFEFSGVVGLNKKRLRAWTNQQLTNSELLSNKNIWLFELEDETGNKGVFFPKRYPENGFAMDFIKLIAYEFVVNKNPLVEFDGNIKKWFEIYNRDKAIQNLLES